MPILWPWQEQVNGALERAEAPQEVQPGVVFGVQGNNENQVHWFNAGAIAPENNWPEQQPLVVEQPLPPLPNPWQNAAPAQPMYDGIAPQDPPRYGGLINDPWQVMMYPPQKFVSELSNETIEKIAQRLLILIEEREAE